MTDLIQAVAERLHERNVPFAVIGAAAMSARGFARQTLDFDLLTTDRSVLAPELWENFSVTPRIGRGDFDDPLAGVVRFRDPDVDLVVGKYKWQAEMIGRAEEIVIGGRRLPVVRLADLVILKLDAGGFRDGADVAMMMRGLSTADVEQVEGMLEMIDPAARKLWERIREGS